MPAANQRDGGGGSERAEELSLSLVGNHRRHADFNPDFAFLLKHQNVCAQERGPCTRGSVHGRTVGVGGVCCLLMSNTQNGGPPPGAEDAAGEPACLSSYADVRFICKKSKKKKK